MNDKLRVSLFAVLFSAILPLAVLAQDTMDLAEDTVIHGESVASEFDGETILDEDAAIDDEESTGTADQENRDSQDEKNTEITGDTDVISVSTELGLQSVITGKIPLIIRITPKIDSSKAQVRWDLPRGLDTSSPEDVWFEMQEGVTREFRIEVSPASAGRYKTVVDVTAWRYDTNYVSSAAFLFEIDEKLHITPAPDGYVRNLMIYRGTLAVLSLFAIIGMFFAVKFGIRYFRKWLAED